MSSGYAVISSMTLQDILKVKWPNLSEKRSTYASKLTGSYTNILQVARVEDTYIRRKFGKHKRNSQTSSIYKFCILLIRKILMSQKRFNSQLNIQIYAFLKFFKTNIHELKNSNSQNKIYRLHQL